MIRNLLKLLLLILKKKNATLALERLSPLCLIIAIHNKGPLLEEGDGSNKKECAQPPTVLFRKAIRQLDDTYTSWLAP